MAIGGHTQNYGDADPFGDRFDEEDPGSSDDNDNILGGARVVQEPPPGKLGRNKLPRKQHLMLHHSREEFTNFPKLVEKRNTGTEERKREMGGGG